jgi:hypothetical protein
MKNVRLSVSCACLFLTACASATTEKYESSLNTWIGRPVTTLVSSWGVPDKQFQVNDSTRLLAYVRSDVMTYPGVPPTCTTRFSTGMATTDCLGGFPPEVQKMYCETTFTVVREKIASWKHRGNNCRE